MSKKTTPQRCGAMELETLMCCGIGEYDGLNNGTSARSYSDPFTSPGAVRAMVEDGNYISRYRNRRDYDDVWGCSHIIMTQVVTQETGYRNLTNFKRYVEKNKLGTVVIAPMKVNPNSRNKLKAAIFTPNVGAMAEWGIARNVKDAAQRDKEDRDRWNDHW